MNRRAPIFVVALVEALSAPGCTLLFSADVPCDASADCNAGEVCNGGFCVAIGAPGGEGEGEGEGDPGEGEGEGEPLGEGEGEGEGFETVCGQQHPIAPWFDVAYDQRQRVAFCDPGAPNAPVDGLPVTVVLRDDNFDFDSARDDGLDVIFVDQRDGGGAILPFERSVFGDGLATFFVRIPSFNPKAQTDSIYVYFDNPGAADESDVEGTWEEYASVWHFEEQGESYRDSVTDATSLVESNILAHATLLGSSMQLNADNTSFARLPAPAGVGITEGSISLLLGPGPTNNLFSARACPGFASPCGHVWFLGQESGSRGFDASSMHLSFVNVDRQLGVSRPSDPSTAGSFSHLSGTAAFDGNDFNAITVSWTATRIEVATLSFNDAGAVVQNITSSTRQVGVAFEPTHLVLGISEDNSDPALSGNIGADYDEVRASPVVHNGAYIRADGLAQLEGLLVFGDPEQQ